MQIIKAKTEIPKKDPFLGVYMMSFSNSKKNISSYCIEFKKDKTARVFLFFKNKSKPKIRKGKYLFSKKGILMVYFPNNMPSEFLIKNDDGSLSILNKYQKRYKGVLGKQLVLKKIK